MTPLTLGTLVAALALTAVPALTAPGPPSDPPVRASSLRSGTWPVWPPVVMTEFDDPLPYQAGHRGLDLLASPGQVVVAAGDGWVTTAGRVAGRSVVVVAHPSGVRTTYLPVSPVVGSGDEVHAGDPIGVVASPLHCPASSCLHWGARRGDRYLDPRSLLPLDAGPIVLLPTSPD